MFVVLIVFVLLSVSVIATEPLVKRAFVEKQGDVWFLKVELADDALARVQPSGIIQFTLTHVGKDDSPNKEGIQKVVVWEEKNLNIVTPTNNILTTALLSNTQFQAHGSCMGKICEDSVFKVTYNTPLKVFGLLSPLSKNNCFDYDVSNPEKTVGVCNIIAEGKCTVDFCEGYQFCHKTYGCIDKSDVILKTFVTQPLDCPIKGYYFGPVKAYGVFSFNQPGDQHVFTSSYEGSTGASHTLTFQGTGGLEDFKKEILEGVEVTEEAASGVDPTDPYFMFKLDSNNVKLDRSVVDDYSFETLYNPAIDTSGAECNYNEGDADASENEAIACDTVGGVTHCVFYCEGNANDADDCVQKKKCPSGQFCMKQDCGIFPTDDNEFDECMGAGKCTFQNNFFVNLPRLKITKISNDPAVSLGHFMCLEGCNEDSDCTGATPYCQESIHKCVSAPTLACADSDGTSISKSSTLSYYPYIEVVGDNVLTQVDDYCSDNNVLPASLASNNEGDFLVEQLCDNDGLDKAIAFTKCNCKNGKCTEPDISSAKQISLKIGEPTGFIMDNEIYEVTLQETVKDYLRLKIKGKRLLAVRSFVKGSGRNLRLGVDKSVEVKVLDILKNGAIVSLMQLHGTPINRILGDPFIEEKAPTLDGTKAPVYDGTKVAPVSGGLGSTAGQFK